MIQVLIVDDEPSVRNGLYSHVNWKNAGIGIVQSAASAEEALEICEDFQPDIVLSDIRMRSMTGIEMSEKILEKYPGCRIIFLSGYADKEYLKAAIHLGAIEYLEKPVSMSVLEKVLQRTADVLRREKDRGMAGATVIDQALLQTAILQHLYSNSQQPLAALEGCSYARVSLIHTSLPVSNIGRFKRTLDALEHDQILSIRNLFVTKDNRNFVLVTGGEKRTLADDGTFYTQLGKDIRGTAAGESRIFVSVGRIVPAEGSVRESWQNAMILGQCLPWTGYGNIVFSSGMADSSRLEPFDPEFYTMFGRAASEGDRRKMQQILDQTGRWLARIRPMNIGYVQNIYYTFAAMLSRESGQSMSDDEFHELDTIADLEEAVRRRMTESESRSRIQTEHDAVSENVKEQIRSRYSDPLLSIQVLADSVGLTPNYLSTVFRKNNGMTISDYLTGIRIEHAKILLRGSALPLSEVAQQAGYDNANYFAKVFRKKTGMSPTEYRDKP